jgi:hypothetical protein
MEYNGNWKGCAVLVLGFTVCFVATLAFVAKYIKLI